MKRYNDTPICPNCGGECETIYIFDDGVYRCEDCVEDDARDAYEWWQEKQEMERDFYDESR